MLCKPYLRRRKIHANAGGVSYYPDQLSKIYSLPAGDGAGKKIAVIELGGGFEQSQLDAYFQSRGKSVKPVQVVLVDGATNTPDGPDGADGEVQLDLQMAGCIAPAAQLICVFAPNTDAGFAAGIQAAVTLKADVISISWGGPENTWTSAVRAAMDAAFEAQNAQGGAVTVAAGDNGSGDGESGAGDVDYPASSRYVIACGGTTLHANATTGAISSESVWNDGTQGGATGGGVSTAYARPIWQANAGVPGNGRGVPDLAAVADPNTGINVSIDGQQLVIGGTSAVAPVHGRRDRVALRAAAASRSAPRQFRLSSMARPAVSTTSPSATTAPTPHAAGWDACTGWGSPIGTAAS